MEKLQSALEKARQKRSGSGTPAQTRIDASRKTTAGKWEDIPLQRPDPAVLKKNLIVTASASTAATPFDILRTKTLLLMRQNGWKRLGITSPAPACGKSTIASNLAMSLARQKDVRSILFDLDLRQPRLHKLLGYEQPRASAGEVLKGNIDFADQAIRLSENLAVSFTDHAEEDPTHILLGNNAEPCLDAISKAYEPDLMIFDLAPLLISDATRAFLRNVDCALLVIRAEKTKYSQFDQCERELAEYTNVLGVTLNACSKTVTGSIPDYESY